MNIQETIYSMLIENTGVAMMDSGGENGRMWQRNKGKTLADFQNEPAVTYELQNDPKDSSDVDYTISVFHYLCNTLALDELCEKYNTLKCDDFDSDIYGVSTEQRAWIDKQGFTVLDSFNTYNGDSSLSQVLQGTYLTLDGTNIPSYVLLQVHGGADVRGGYTCAKLFKIADEYMALEDVYGSIDGIAVSNMYDGRTLTNEDTGENVPVTVQSKIELSLYNY